jgi:hypothetical protein
MHDESPRLQFRIADFLLATALIGSIVGSIASDVPEIAFITASCLGVFIWHRPIVSRLWAVGMIGLGAGLFAGGCHGEYSLSMPDGDLVGWGAGMVVGSVAYLIVLVRRNRLQSSIPRTPGASSP